MRDFHEKRMEALRGAFEQAGAKAKRDMARAIDDLLDGMLSAIESLERENKNLGQALASIKVEMPEPRQKAAGIARVGALRLEEVSERTGLSVRTLRNIAYKQRKGISTGHPHLEFRHVGRLLTVDSDVLDAWMKEHDKK